MRNNTSPGIKLQATIAVQSERLLNELAALGIYGRSKGDVAGRFIEEALRKLAQRPMLRQRRSAVIPKGKVRQAEPKLAIRRRRRGRG